MTVRVVLAEDNFLLREGVRGMLAGSGSIEVVGSCGDLAEALESIDTQVPDVVLTDIRMPRDGRDEGIVIAAHCRRRFPTMGVVLLSQYAEASYVRTLLTEGTQGRGYLLKERVADLDDLLAAIRAVAAGGSAIDPKVVETLVTGRSLAGDQDLARLTPREREVLAGIAQGRTNAAIASELFLTQHAVEKHINAIFTKLGLSGDRTNHPRVRATLMYLAEGKAQPDKFGTIPDAMWWAIVTLGTIGYGDVVPVTPFGRILATGTIFLGLIMVALPVGIVAQAFASDIHRREFIVTWGMVARVPLFAGLDANQIAEIMRLLRSQRIEAGTIIARRGEPAQSMYFVAAVEVRSIFRTAAFASERATSSARSRCCARHAAPRQCAP